MWNIEFVKNYGSENIVIKLIVYTNAVGYKKIGRQCFKI